MQVVSIPWFFCGKDVYYIRLLFAYEKYFQLQFAVKNTSNICDFDLLQHLQMTRFVQRQ